MLGLESMGVVITGNYLGDKRVELTHLDSGATIRTVAPKDNHGDGTLFSPTDMLAGSLGACILTTIAIVVERDGLDLRNSTFRVVKEMSSSPRMVKNLAVEIHLPETLEEPARKKIERAGGTCPVHHSLHSDVTVEIKYIYDIAASIAGSKQSTQ